MGTVNLAPPMLFQDLAVVLCKLLDLFSNYPQNSIYVHQSFEQNNKWIFTECQCLQLFQDVYQCEGLLLFKNNIFNIRYSCIWLWNLSICFKNTKLFPFSIKTGQELLVQNRSSNKSAKYP